MCRSKSSVSLGVVLAEHRHAGSEDEVEAAGRVDERQARIEREVHVRIRFLSGRPKIPKVRTGVPWIAQLRDERAAFRLVDAGAGLP